MSGRINSRYFDHVVYEKANCVGWHTHTQRDDYVLNPLFIVIEPT